MRAAKDLPHCGKIKMSGECSEGANILGDVFSFKGAFLQAVIIGGEKVEKMKMGSELVDVNLLWIL